MADIEYTQSPEAFQLITRLGQQGGGDAGLGGIGSLYEQMIRQKMAQQQAAQKAAAIPVQRPMMGAGRGRTRAEMDDEDFKRQTQQLQLKAMKQQLVDAERARQKSNVKKPRLVRNIGGAGTQPGTVTVGGSTDPREGKFGSFGFDQAGAVYGGYED